MLLSIITSMHTVKKKPKTCIHLNVVRRSKLAGFRRGPPKRKQNQTEEFSSQHVIFMLLWTTEADLRSCLSQQSVQGSNLCTGNLNDYNILAPSFVPANVVKSSRFMWEERNVSRQLSERGGTLTAAQCEGPRLHSGQMMPFNSTQKPFL